MNETQYQESIVELAQRLGWRVAHFKKVRIRRPDGSTYWATPCVADGKGFVDLVLVRERVIWAEIKVGRNTLEPDQIAWKEALIATGQEYYEWHEKDWDDIVSILTKRTGDTK